MHYMIIDPHFWPTWILHFRCVLHIYSHWPIFITDWKFSLFLFWPFVQTDLCLCYYSNACGQDGMVLLEHCSSVKETGKDVLFLIQLKNDADLWVFIENMTFQKREKIGQYPLKYGGLRWGHKCSLMPKMKRQFANIITPVFTSCVALIICNINFGINSHCGNTDIQTWSKSEKNWSMTVANIW